MGPRSGIEGTNRVLLETLHHTVSGPFTAAVAAEALDLEPPRARRLLAYLAARGWLSRVRHGLYTLVPLGATSPSRWREDPWVAASATFAPCYVGGWSACEHWGLTEQLFRDVVVITASPLREREATIQDTSFRVKYLRPSKHFGTRPVWRGQTRVQVSDPSRTVVDILDDPSLGGGIRHVAEIVAAYFGSEHRNDELLAGYAGRLGNRTVFKRLGYLLETLQIEAPELIDVCLAMKSSGISRIDPSGPAKGRTVKRWNLRVNAEVERAEPS